MAVSPISVCYPETRFGGYTQRDGTVAFYTRVNALLRPEHVVLDVGCGRGSFLLQDDCPWRRGLHLLKGKARRVIGIDVDKAAGTSAAVDEFRLISAGADWPVETSSIDLLVSDFVLEHVEHPAAYFAEANRVLKPGGYLCLRTPNAFGYVAIISKLLPNRLHAKAATTAQIGREEEDVFPTFYRANRPRTLRKLLRSQGLSGCVLAIEPEPGYMSFSSIAYRCAALLHAVMPPLFRSTLLVFARKPGPDDVGGR